MLIYACPVYRLNTFPFIHLGFFHALVNILALTPLMERFEAEHGTLTTLAMFGGRELPDDTVKQPLAEETLMGRSSIGDTSGCLVHTH